MKIRTMVFVVVAMTLIGAIGYYIGSSNREESLDMQLISNPVVEIKQVTSTEKNIVEETSQEQTSVSSTSLTVSKQIEVELEHQKQKTGEYYANEVREPDRS